MGQKGESTAAPVNLEAGEKSYNGGRKPRSVPSQARREKRVTLDHAQRETNKT